MRLIYSIGLTSLLVGLWVVQTCSAALPNGAQNLEDQQSAKPASGNRLVNRAIRGSQSHVNAPTPRSIGQAKSQPAHQKTTPSPPPPAEAENESEVGEEKPEGTEVEGNPIEESVSSTTTSTTEALRRKPNGWIRPIQSRDDFMERLKRRRKEQHQPGYTLFPPSSTSTTEKPQKLNAQNRKTNPPKTPTPPTNQGSPKKATPNRRYSAKGTTPTQTTPLPASSNEAIAEESNLATQSSKIRSYPKARRTSAS